MSGLQYDVVIHVKLQIHGCDRYLLAKTCAFGWCNVPTFQTLDSSCIKEILKDYIHKNICIVTVFVATRNLGVPKIILASVYQGCQFISMFLGMHILLQLWDTCNYNPNNPMNEVKNVPKTSVVYKRHLWLINVQGEKSCGQWSHDHYGWCPLLSQSSHCIHHTWPVLLYIKACCLSAKSTHTESSWVKVHGQNPLNTGLLRKDNILDVFVFLFYFCLFLTKKLILIKF